MAERHEDQAAGLRRLFQRRPRRVIAVVAAQAADSAAAVAACATELAARHLKVLVLDEHEGAASVAARLGSATPHDLLQAARGHVDLAKALIAVGARIRLLACARAMAGLRQLDNRTRLAVARKVADAERDADVVLVHADPALPEGWSPLAQAAGRVVLAVPGSVAGVAEALGLLGAIHPLAARGQYDVVFTRQRDGGAAEALLALLRRDADALGVVLDGCGSLPVPHAYALGYRALAGAAAMADALLADLPPPLAPDLPVSGPAALAGAAALA